MARKMTVTLEHETEKGWEIVAEDVSSVQALASAKSLARDGATVRLTLSPFVKATESEEPEGEGDEGAEVEAEVEAEEPKRGRARS